MTEQSLQKKRIEQLEAEGYYVIKMITTNKNGVPDLIAVKPSPGTIFCEVKRPGGSLSPLQKMRIRHLLDRGFNVEIYDGVRRTPDKYEISTKDAGADESTTTDIF